MTGRRWHVRFGTVFKLKADGTGFAILHSFASVTGSSSTATGLVLDGAGYLYGTRSVNDAASDSGVVFKMKTDGTGYSILHTFKGGANDGASPQASLALDGSGFLFGTTSGGGSAGFGTVFRLRTDGTSFAIVALLHQLPDRWRRPGGAGHPRRSGRPVRDDATRRFGGWRRRLQGENRRFRVFHPSQLHGWRRRHKPLLRALARRRG